MRPWRGWRPVSLRVRLALALALAAALPLLVLITLFTSRERWGLRTSALNNAEDYAVALAMWVADYVDLQRASVVALAEQPGLVSAPADMQGRELSAAKRAYPDTLSYALFDSAGVQLARSDDISNTVPITGYPVFEQARSHGQPSLDVLISPVYHRPVLALGAPVRDNRGDFAGVVVGALPTTHLADSLLQRSINLGNSGLIYLVDERGRVIAHPDEPLMTSVADNSSSSLVSAVLDSSRESGSFSYDTPDGEQLAGYARVPGLRWAVIVERPAASALSGLRQTQLTALAILAVCLALTVAGGLVLAGSVTAPLRALLAAVQAMPASMPHALRENGQPQAPRQSIGSASGTTSEGPDLAGTHPGVAHDEDSSRLLASTDVIEVIQLAAAFESLQARLAMRTNERERAEASLRDALEALRHANEDLERQVAIRTDELNSVNEKLRGELAERVAILASMTEGLVIADLEGNIVHMNPEALRIYGFSRVEEAERPNAEYAHIFEAHYLDGRPMPFDLWPLNRALRGETFSSLDILMRRIGSGDAWIGSFGGAPVHGADESMVLAIVTLRDVTRQKQMEWERERLLSQVQESATELAEREAALSAARDELERRVQERTGELSTANQRLHILYDITQAILSARSPAEIAQAALERLGEVLRCDRMSVVMFEPEAGLGRILAATGVPIPSLRPGDAFSLAEWLVPDELRTGQIHRSTDLSCDGDPASNREALLSVGLSLRLQTPLLVGDELIGTLNLLTAQPSALHQDAEEIVRQVALSLAVAIHNARLGQQVQTSRAQLQALSRRLVEVQENERRAIARELHDEAGQALTTLMIGLGLLAREASQPDAVLARVEDLKRTTDNVLEDLHSLAVDLRPASLDRLGLLPALRQYVETFRRQSKLDVVLEEVGLEGERFLPEVETTVYRVVQEAMTNVARHAKASYVGVLLERREDSLVVIVEDDGIGFDAEEAIQRGRLGLIGMRERAEMVGGRLTVESMPGQGSTLFIEVPA